MSNFTKLKLCHTLGISQSTHIWVKGALTALLLVLCGNVAKAQSDLKFKEGIRYSKWVIDSRMNDFYANTTKCGFAVYDQSGNKTSDRVDGKKELDYVVGLVAKSIIEASQYYSQFEWAQSFAKPWFLSIQDYGDNFYSKFTTDGGSLDDLNAVKLFIPLRAMTATNGKYPNTTTYGHTETALDNAITGLNAHNTKYRIKDENILAKKAGHDVLGGWWHKSIYENQMWLDGAYMGSALFAELVNYSGNTTNIDATNDWNIIVKQFTILRSMCWNETDKLPYHAFAADGGTNTKSHSDTWAGLRSTSPYVFHSASYWGRAVGWYFLALVDILEQMEKANIASTDSKFTTLKGYLAETAEGLKARQDQATGGWYQILDENGTYSASEYNNGLSHTTTYNYIESSATALFTAAYLKAIRKGYLAENVYKTVAVNGYKCLVNQFFSVDDNGNVNIFGSCRSAGLGGNEDKNAAGKEKFRDGSKPYYLLGKDVAMVKKSENITEGKVLGAFILAATEYERQYQNYPLLSEDLRSSYSLSNGKSISVEVTGNSSYTVAYQWYKYDATTSTSTVIDNATEASFKPTASGKYYCEITLTQESSSAITRAANKITYQTRTTDVEVTGTAANLYTVTLNTGTNGTCSTTSLTQKSAGAAITLPDATPRTGYTFDGWYTTETGGNKVSSPYIPTADITLYAHYTPTSTGGGSIKTEIFSLTNVTPETVPVGGSAKIDDIASYATITGGSAQLKNGKSNPQNMISGGQINLNGSSGSYIYIKLDEPLQAGDEIVITPANSTFKISNTSSNKNATSIGSTYTVKAGDKFVDQKEIYLFKTGVNGESATIESITISRPNPGADSRATFTYNGSQLSFTETAAGTYTTTIEIVASKRGEPITITPAVQEGATIKEGETTVTSPITITPPSEAGQTTTKTYTVTSSDGTSKTTYTINVTVVKEKLVLVYSDKNGNTEWTWNKTASSTKPTFNSPTVKAYYPKSDGTADTNKGVTDGLSYTYVSDMGSVATVNSSGTITIGDNTTGGAKIYATLVSDNYYADPVAFDITIIDGYSYKVSANEKAPGLNESLYITTKEDKTGETGTKLVKMTFGGWKWHSGAYSVTRWNEDRTEKITKNYIDSWKNAGSKANDIASIDGHYYWFEGGQDAVDESRAESEGRIYGSYRYGWFKWPTKTTDSDGATYKKTNPFTLPVRGAFMTFEPTQNGVLTVYILQNGAWNTNDNGGTKLGITYNKGDIIPGEFRPHSFFVTNQRGVLVEDFAPLTHSVETKQKATTQYKCILKGSEGYDATDPYNIANWTEFKDYMTSNEQAAVAASWTGGAGGAQKIVKLDNGSYLAIQKGIVKYSFFVTANETYYLFSNFSKMGFSGANFIPDTEKAPTNDSEHKLVLTDETKYPTIAKVSGSTDEGENKYAYTFDGTIKGYVPEFTIPLFYSIQLDRTFKPGQWTTLTLPFNLTQTEVEQIFGVGTRIVMLKDGTIKDEGARLTFIYHEIQNILPGYPYLIKPTLKDSNKNSYVSITSSTDGSPLRTISSDGSLTSFTVYTKAINPNIKQIHGNQDCNHYWHKGTPGYSYPGNPVYFGENAPSMPYSIKYPANDIFVSEGNGNLYVSEGSSYGWGYRSWIAKKEGTATAKSISVVIGSFSDDDDTTTSIDVAELAPDVLEAFGIQTGVYNLSGQRVANDTRNLKAGIYIVNGKKTVVR